MRIGIIGLLHESNTFLSSATEREAFLQQTFLESTDIIHQFPSGHHEINGFLDGLASAAHAIEIVPILVARALPSGVISRSCWQWLMSKLERGLAKAGPVDGLLVAPHGATVSEDYPDADGHWLSLVRATVGETTPIIGTLDPHANLSQQMVTSCDALIAYQTNPHVDQYQRGCDAVAMMVNTLLGQTKPVMRAAFPPLAINIERQMTGEPHWLPHYQLAQRQRAEPGVLSTSIVLGFPYADVEEMGSATICVADSDAQLAETAARQLAVSLWKQRETFRGQLTSVDTALNHIPNLATPVCLLDMGDNVGGGSAADGTILLQALERRGIQNSFACLFDPDAVQLCDQATPGSRMTLSIGGHTDSIHGLPLKVDCKLISLHAGRFQESEVRHGGIASFDQGRTAVIKTAGNNTVMLTSKRMVPFSLQQLLACQLDPHSFDVIVAKGVNAPIAAYRDVCKTFVRVNTPGSTSADMLSLEYNARRQPLFPFEQCEWP